MSHSSAHISLNTVRSVQLSGSSGIIIDIEIHLSNGLPNVIVVGMTNKSVDESRERIRAAFHSSGLQFPRKRVTINLAPADVQKLGSGFDVAIAAALMHATGLVRIPPTSAFFGELGLDGTIRPVRGIIGGILAARDHGLKKLIIPFDNLLQAQLVPDVELVPVRSLRELYDWLASNEQQTALHTGNGVYDQPDGMQVADIDIADVVGQERAKRALLLAAAGGHNVLLNGSPGMGKSMLARTLPGLLPALHNEEALQITHLHSLGSADAVRVQYARPFRAPHHSASDSSLIGGGAQPRPGEISLASGGVLFLDELPEFRRSAIEALRQPLEDRTITIARARSQVTFPADFILAATRNPCPCGYFGTANPASPGGGNTCTCTAAQIQHYNKKLSGPIMDRIDLHVTVDPVNHQTLLTTTKASHSSTLRRLVERARSIQHTRYATEAAATHATTPLLNAATSSAQIKKYALLTPDAITLLNKAAQKLGLSPRVYMKTIKIARTIADLDANTTTEAVHIAEALQYRPIPLVFQGSIC